MTVSPEENPSISSSLTLSIIIPIYNEVHSLATVIDAVTSVNLPIQKEIILIDDGSTDGTRQLIMDTLQHKVQHVIFHEKNQGKGAAVTSGLQKASGDILIIQDADLEYNPKDYPMLIEPILNGESKVIYGSRFLNTSQNQFFILQYLANRFLTALSNSLLSQHLTDMETCYKVMHKDIYKQLHLTEKRFGIEPEITAKISKLGIKITERPIQYTKRSYKDGKKITYKDGLYAIIAIIKYRFFQ